MAIFSPYKKNLTYLDVVGLDVSLLGFSILCGVIAYSDELESFSQSVIFIICVTLAVETVIAVIDLMSIIYASFKALIKQCSKIKVKPKDKSESKIDDLKQKPNLKIDARIKKNKNIKGVSRDRQNIILVRKHRNPIDQASMMQSTQ